MESGDGVGGGAILYDTLDLLSPSPADAGPPLSPYTPPPYTVFRSKITASVNEIPVISAEEYYPLDVGTADEFAVTPLSVRDDGSLRPDHALETAWFRPNARFKSPMVQLHQEILDFCDFISPTQEEQASREAAVQAVTSVINYIWPRCKVEVFGSYKTGLFLPTSDIDVVILNSEVSTPQIGLKALSKGLKQKGIAKKIQVIARARVPIIKFIEKQSGVAFDISFDMTNGPQAAVFIKDVINKIPPLRPLCLILKVFLQQRELNEVYTGGIGSYALLTMIIAHLQCHWRGQDLKHGKSSLEQNLGILLIKFFELYGCKLNLNDVGVSCSGACNFFFKRDRGFLNREKPYLISIEDPQDSDNDIGKNSYNYYQIRSAFSTAHSKLTDAKKILALGANRSILGTIIRPDPLLLKRKGGSNGEITFNRLLPGAGEAIDQQSHGSGVHGNWDLIEDEPLPRGNGVTKDKHIRLCRKSRKLIEKIKNSGQSSSGKKRKRDENGSGKWASRRLKKLLAKT